MVKLQIVVDPLIADCIEQLPGRSKVDKIRWALCVYREVLKAKAHDSVAQVTERAGQRYRRAGDYV